GTPTTPSGDGEGGIPGLGVPYQDFIPFYPMVKDPATGQWRNAEPGEIPGAGGDQPQPGTQTPEPQAPPPEPQPGTQTPEGQAPQPGLTEAEEQALREAGLTPDQIGWVEARVVDPGGTFTMEYPGFTDHQWELIGGIQDKHAAQTTAPPPPTEEPGKSGAHRMADSELDGDYWYPDYMPPGLELRDHHTWSDEHGNEHRVYTDQHGRKWDWSGEKEARGDNSLGYTDADGRWHQVSAYDGMWMDTWWDENGEVRSGELGTTPEELKGQRPVLDPNNVQPMPMPSVLDPSDMWSGPLLLPEEGAVPNPEGGDGGEPQPGAQTPEPPAQPPPGDGEGGIPGLGVPYRDFIPTFPMVKDPTTGQWRNAEPGEIPGPPVEQSPPPEQAVQPAPPPPPEGQPPPVAEQQPAPAPAPAPPHDDPANGGGEGLPDGDADGIPGEYGDGPDLDGNGIPDEIGINPDSLQPGYPSPSSSGDGGDGEGAALDPTGSAYAGATYGSGEWGGVGVPDPTGVPQSDATTGAAEAMPEEEYGGGSEPDANWVPEETAVDPYALQQPAYADPSTSGDEAWDPYAGGSSFEPYVPPEEAPLEEEAPVAEGEDPNTLGSF
ncbi:MAG: hypothetical protein M3N33_02935, partial [Actinomycetota bacterium]|nr:hypothetical protein [Actinomycetota bacterium]